MPPSLLENMMNKLILMMLLLFACVVNAAPAGTLSGRLQQSPSSLESIKNCATVQGDPLICKTRADSNGKGRVAFEFTWDVVEETNIIVERRTAVILWILKPACYEDITEFVFIRHLVAKNEWEQLTGLCWEEEIEFETDWVKFTP
jgi:hypothetical protein